MLVLLVSTLNILGINNIVKAKQGEEAFTKFQKHNPDLVITDWLMEPVDGLHLVRNIRHNAMSVNRRVPVINMTGFSALPRVEKARDFGVTEFLVKPFTAESLSKRLTSIIEKPRDFIETEDFFGPDRRRRRNKNYHGPFRRDDDQKTLMDGNVYKA